MKVFRRPQLPSRPGLSTRFGLQQGKSSGVAGGGGSLGLSGSFLIAATDLLVEVESSRDRFQFGFHGHFLTELKWGTVHCEINKSRLY